MENSNQDQSDKATLTPNSLASVIDHTLLKQESTSSDIIRLCKEAHMNQLYSVCVSPHYVSLAAEQLKDSSVKVCTVIGFPNGYSTLETKAYETSDAIAKGADEIDMVINVGALKDKQHDYLRKEILAVRQACAGHVLKVIIETSLLSQDEKSVAAAIVREAGADFVKTSTGFADGGATIDDVRLLRSAVGPDIGVKASGGIKNFETAKAMIEAGASRLGTSSGVAIVNNEAASPKEGAY